MVTTEDGAGTGEGESPRTIESVARTVLPAELLAAIEATPGLFIPFVSSFSGLEILKFREKLGGESAVSSLAAYSLEGILAALIGLAFYTLGSLWDDLLFNPLYRPQTEKKSAGLLASRDRAILLVVPGGSKLNELRSSFAKVVGLDTPSGAYQRAEIVLRRSGHWEEVKAPLVLSKFARSFALPSVLVGGALLWKDTPLFGYLFVGLGLFSLVPFLQYRVKHMKLLYEVAALVCSSPTPHTPDRPPESVQPPA